VPKRARFSAWSSAMRKLILSIFCDFLYYTKDNVSVALAVGSYKGYA
jgi:hypothetical protein